MKFNSRKITIRKATVNDAKYIHSLINKFAKKDDMLSRSLHEIFEHIRDYFVCEIDDQIVAACALHPVWEDIAEIRSIAVSRKYQRQGIGKRLIRKSLREASSLGMKKVFALTYKPDYFRRLGFVDIDKNELPHKIWGDCLKCSKFPDCPEVAVIYHL